MKCPACKTEGAYVGSLQVECLNFNCRHYSAKWVSDSAKDKLSKEGVIAKVKAKSPGDYTLRPYGTAKVKFAADDQDQDWSDWDFGTNPCAEIQLPADHVADPAEIQKALAKFDAAYDEAMRR